MTEQELRETVAKNLIAYRKLNKLTQLELAEKINYSDKSVSKWERGDGLPDLYVLKLIADLYDISVNDLISQKKPKKYRSSRKKQHILIPLLSIALVWLVATIAYMIISMIPVSLKHAEFAFVYAIPVCMILLIVYTALWWSQVAQMISISGLIWTVTLCIYISVPISGVYLIWSVAAVIQLMEILWFILRYRKRKS